MNVTQAVAIIINVNPVHFIRAVQQEQLVIIAQEIPLQVKQLLMQLLEVH